MTASAFLVTATIAGAGKTTVLHMIAVALFNRSRRRGRLVDQLRGEAEGLVLVFPRRGAFHPMGQYS